MLALIFISILLGLCGICYLGFKRIDNEIIFIGTVILCFFSLVALITLPFARMNFSAQVQEFNQTIRTIDVARENTNSFEGAAMVLKIIECNSWLANAQYYNASFFDIYVPDVVDKLQPIK